MITKTHIDMLERQQQIFVDVPDYLPYSYVMQCQIDASLMSDVIKLCKEHCVND